MFGFQRGFFAVGLAGLGLAMTAGAEEAVPAGEIVGFVCEIEGNWTVELADGERGDVELGQTLEAGARLQPKESGDQLVIAYADGTLRECPAEDCDPLPPSAHSTAADLSLGERLSRAFKRLFSHPHEHYVETLSRGPGDPAANLADAVLKGGDEVDLSPALRGLDVGEYRLLLRPVEDESAAPVRIDLEWRPGDDGAKAALPPGLYRATEIERSDWQIPTGRGAWLLVVPAGSFDDADSQFRRLAEIASGWTEQLGHDRSRALLRAALETLAEDHGLLPPADTREGRE